MKPELALLIKAPIAAIPYVGGVIAEVISYFDAKYLNERLSRLEQTIEAMGISLEQFEEQIGNLDEHGYYCARNNLRHLLTTAEPEVVGTLNIAIIKYIFDSKHDMTEAICEIIRELNSRDIEFLTQVNEFREKHKERMQQQLIDSRANTKEIVGLKARNQFFPNATILWHDFCTLGFESDGGRSTVPFEGLLAVDFEDVKLIGEPVEPIKYAFFAASLLKLKNLGVIMTEYIATLGTINPSNIDRIHITSFGERLLLYVKEAIDNTKQYIAN